MSTAYQSQPTQLQSVANNPYASASLYVGDLAPEVTEATLFELFNAVGPVASIRVCRDSTTRRSLGYAYVNFHSVQDAERALDTMNFTNIRGRQCRIMWSQRDPVLRKSGKGNIFVKNLHTSIDNKTLYDTFSVFGSILSCKVMTNKNGQSLGYGYVHYASDDSATKAIEGVNGMLISDKEVVAQRFLPREERLKSTKYTKFTNVYVKYIPKDWTEDKLKTLIAEKVPNAKVTSLVFWKESYGVSSCINFGDPEQAKDVVEKLNDLLVNAEDTLHPKLYVARAMDRAERDFYLKKQKKAKYGGRKTFFGVNLYTKNLPEDTDDVKLREMFEPYGKITSAKVMTDPKTGRSRGFGFVCFERKEDASRAMTELNSKNLGGKPLYVSRAQRKAVRAAWLAKQRSRFQQQMYMPSGMQRPPFQQQQPYYSQFRQQPPPYPRSMPMQYPQMFPQAAPPFGQVSQQKPFSNVPQQGFVQHHQGFPQQFSQPIQSRPQVQYGTQFSVPRNISGANQPSVAPVPGSQPADGSSVGVSGVPHMGAPQQQMSSAPQGQQPSAPMADHTPLTVQMLNSVKAEERKRLIGERLFPKIQAVEPRLAGKITGMLLEMDNTELLHLLETQHALMSKINEALQVLKEHMSQKNPSQKNPGSGAQSSQRGVNPQE